MKRSEKSRAAFPFHDPENVAVFTCCHVLEQGEEIRWVGHDEEDGAWQFLCGGEHDEVDVRIVGLGEIWAFDETVGELADLPLGGQAERDGKGDRWRVWA